ncbi:MAG: 3-dehydroquinate dehydratase [Rhodobacter sp. CACIA14H1]|jgi:nucleoside-triphosphatase THEP1|nr:MAG: 3-dehydroquinate dehydratase [Rhodobacter sp. CACIA14H1]
MKIAYVTLQGRGRTDELIASVAERLAAKGLRLAGTVQSNHDRPDRKKCDMDLRVLPDGPTVRISEDRGELARGCILDSGALEQTVFEVERRLDGADILIVNKFGKRESEGKGLAPVIAEALHRDMPVLVGVNGLNLAAFLAFAGEEIEGLATCPDIVTDWCLAAIVKQIA